MYLLDTDTVANAFDKRRSQPFLRQRILAEPQANLHVGMPTMGEIARGWLASINEARKPPRSGAKIVEYYRLFQLEIEYLFKFTLLPYAQDAEAVFQTIPAPVRQKHSIDCHLAAIALSRGLIVVTSNLRHFEQIPGLRCVDWTLPPGEK